MEGLGLEGLLSPEELAEAKRTFEVMKQATEGDLWRIACLLAGKRDDQLFGRTEFEVRDEVHRIGAKAIQTAVEGRKKRGTKVPVSSASNAMPTPVSSSGGKKPTRA